MVFSQLVSDSGLPQLFCSKDDPKRRGTSTIGYLEGMARTYARVYCNFKKDPTDQFADAMARGVAPGARQLDDERNLLDAVKKYAAKFDAFEVEVSVDGIDVLRAVFTTLFSVGMLDSNGKHCCGWDRGKLDGWGDPTKKSIPPRLTQRPDCTSSVSTLGLETREISKIFSRDTSRPHFLAFLIFSARGLTCNPDNWENFGAATDEGFKFQKFSKECPAFTIELAALAIRVRANHWGPFNANPTTVEIVRPCWNLLLDIEDAIDELDGCIAVAM